MILGLTYLRDSTKEFSMSRQDTGMSFGSRFGDMDEKHRGTVRHYSAAASRTTTGRSVRWGQSQQTTIPGRNDIILEDTEPALELPLAPDSEEDSGPDQGVQRFRTA